MHRRGGMSDISGSEFCQINDFFGSKLTEMMAVIPFSIKQSQTDIFGF